MLASTMSTFVSLTVHCARCHDHKFDPIPQADYYSLQAVFAGVDRGDRAYESPEIASRRAQIETQLASIRERLEDLDRRIDAQVAADPEVVRLSQERASLRESLAAAPTEPPAAASDASGKSVRPGDGPSPTNGYHSAIAATPETSAWVQVDLGASVSIEAIRLYPARPVDFPDTPGFGFPKRFRVEVSEDPAFAPGSSELIAEESRPDSASAADEPYQLRLEGVRGRYVRVTATRLWKRTNDYVFALAELEAISGGQNRAHGASVSSSDSIEAGRWSRANLVDGFDSRRRLPAVDDPAALARLDRLFRVQQIEEALATRRSTAEAEVDPPLRDEEAVLRAERSRLMAERASLPEPSLVYGIQPREPRPIHRLRRGDVEQPAEPSKPGALTCIEVPGQPATFGEAAGEDEGARRKALADWLASPGNVLTWRSIANRVWHYHFGRGIVDSPNDFGRNGSLPTHPELLDWLAVELLENGQSIKALHRQIVRSAAYRQASRGDQDNERIDAENRFLWRQNRRRLDSEALRDSVLAVCGTLDRRMGGPGFDLFRFKDDHSPVYDHSDPAHIDNPSVRRRTVYRFVVRSVPNPFLEALDCADPNLNTPVRSQTLTALQALALLNDRFMIGESEAFAARLESQPGDLGSRIVAAYRIALGRPPRDSERDALASYAARHGLANACRILLNTNEFMFVD
jgi:hypothetical protein